MYLIISFAHSSLLFDACTGNCVDVGGGMDWMKYSTGVATSSLLVVRYLLCYCMYV